MEKMHIMQDDDPVFTRSAPITVGTMARALGDSKSALSASTKLAERVDDVDELLDDLAKSSAAFTEAIKSIDSGTKAAADELAKIKAAIDTPGTLAKCYAWERVFFEKQWAAEVKKGHTGVDFETYLAQIEGEREMRKRAERDDYPIEPISEARFHAQFRIVR